MVDQQTDLVLVIDSDDDERDVIVEAALVPYGYEVEATGDSTMALNLALDNPPDVIVLELVSEEGLSGADLMTALRAQAIEAPVIVIGSESEMKSILHAFRLGASDYLMRPVREAELIQAVDRATRERRLLRERSGLVGEAQSASQSIEQSLRDVRALTSVGRQVIALAKPEQLFDRVMRVATQLTGADSVGIFLRDPGSDALIMRAGSKLPRHLVEQMGQPIEDDLAVLAMNSGETYVGSGSGSQQFRSAVQDVDHLIYAPMVFEDSGLGVLWVARTVEAFADYHREYMTTLGDYLAIAVANARLYNTLQMRVADLDEAHDRIAELEDAIESPEAGSLGEVAIMGGVQDTVMDFRRPLTELLGNMNMFRTGDMGPLEYSQQAAVDVMHRQLDQLVAQIDALTLPTEDNEEDA